MSEHLEQETKQIGKEALVKADQTLKKYKAGKANLEKRIIAAEQWWKLQNWDAVARESAAKGNPGDIRPVSAWLFNGIMGKHADSMDAFPEPIILPREEADEPEAKMLSSIIPVVLQQAGFDETYSDLMWQKIKYGTAVYGVMWDGDRHNGLGDVAIKKMNILNMFWEPGIEDIQESENVFTIELVDKDRVMNQYPQITDKLVGGNIGINRFMYEDSVDTSSKVTVVDWYYRKRVNGQLQLHYCKYVGNTVLFATENEEEYMDKGLYADGQYPFVFDRLFPIEGSPCGFGYVDVQKSPQEFIDTLNQQIIKNAVQGATPRYLAPDTSSINEEEFSDFSLPLVHYGGNLDKDRFIPLETKPLDGSYIAVAQNLIEEMKQTSGNMDVQNGATPSGVTAASAIAALQEVAGRSSRDANRTSYRGYKRMISMVIERIRQFYDIQRKFRIVGESGANQFITYSNSNIMPQDQGNDFGVDMGFRLPVFDVDVQAQKQSPYTRIAQNELAIQLYNLGIFNPQMSSQAIQLLEMMDFKGRDELISKLQEAGTQQEMLKKYLNLAMALTQKYEPNMMPVLAQDAQMLGMNLPPMGSPAAIPVNLEGGEKKEHAFVANQRARVRDLVQPAQ